jgi:putative ABC transport system permease protein
VALAAHRHGQRQQDPVAVLKTLGVTPGGILGLVLARLGIIGAAACLAGLALGAAGQSLALVALRDLVPVELPAPGPVPLLIGAGTGLTCLAAFAGPPLLRLRTVPPVRVLRREPIPDAGLRAVAWSAGAAAVVLLMLAYSRSVVLTGWLLLGTAGTVALFLAAAAALLRTGRLVGTRAGSAWRLGLARLQRRRGESQVQILVFGLAILLLLVLTLLRTALIAEWRAQVPDNAPDHFALNVAREEVAPFTALLREGVAGEPVLRPTLRARVTAVNGEPVDRDTEEGRDLFREHTLSTAASLPDANEVVEGRFWSDAPDDPMQASVASEFARDVGLTVGDRVRFGLGGLPIDVTVTSLREVDWDSLEPNFLFLLPPQAVADYPTTYITAFHLAVDRKAFLERLLRRFPTVTIIEVDAVVEQIQRIVDRVTLAVEGVLALVLLAGVLVLVAAIRSSLDERLRAFGLLRALGAGRRHIRTALLVEFGALGAASGVLAAAGAELTVYLLATQVFELAPRLHGWVWLAGPAAGIAIVGGVGTLACRSVLSVPPALVLRDTAAA